MPYVMHLFLSPGEGGEFVGWQGRHCAPSPPHSIMHNLFFACFAFYHKNGASMLVSFCASHNHVCISVEPTLILTCHRTSGNESNEPQNEPAPWPFDGTPGSWLLRTRTTRTSTKQFIGTWRANTSHVNDWTWRTTTMAT